MAYIEIDLDEFSDEEISEEFYARKLDGGENDDRLREIFIEFESGRIEEAMILLERLYPRLRGISDYVANA